MRITWGYIFLIFLGCRHLAQVIITRSHKPGHGKEWLSTAYLGGSHVICALYAFMALEQRPFPDVIQLTGFGVIILSLILRFTALVQLGNNFSYQLRIAQDHELITHGVYARLRHPLHVAFLGEVLGMAMLSMHPVALLVTVGLVPVILYRNRQEDNALKERFGEKFSRYRAITPSMIPCFLLSKPHHPGGESTSPGESQSINKRKKQKKP